MRDQCIIITGASAGIGAATALACARLGMNLVLNARRADKLESVAAQCRAIGRQVECVVGDVTDPGISGRMLDAATARFGGFYAVLANAGYGFHMATHELSNEALRRIFDVNFFASVDLLAEAARRLIRNAGSEATRGSAAASSAASPWRAHLMMVSSGLAKFSLPCFAAYSATKAAQNHICMAMRMELRPWKIAVSSVHPITTETEFFDAGTLARQDVAAEQPHRNSPQWLIQKPEVVANAIVRCLRRPRAEVWTNTIARFGAGMFGMFPGLAQRVLSKL